MKFGSITFLFGFVWAIGCLGKMATAASLPTQIHGEGARRTLDITVRNDQGKFVEGAEVSLGFWSPYSTKSLKNCGITDKDGHVILSQKCHTDGSFSVVKAGYYRTRQTLSEINASASAETVRKTFWGYAWINPEIKSVVLRDKREPRPLLARWIELKVPVVDMPIGFDLERMDWIAPHGKGLRTDCLITFITKPYRNWREVGGISIHFPNKYDGMQRCKGFLDSDLFSDYHVNTNRTFQNTIRLDSVSRTQFLDASTYLTFRVRSVVDSQGHFLFAHYGKIYPSIDATTEKIYIRALYFNPTPNDTNLEFDPKRNLVPEKELRRYETLCP